MCLTMPNKEEEILNRTRAFLQYKIDLKLSHELRKELDEQLQKELLDPLRKNYPHLKDFIDTVGFDVKVERRFGLEVKEMAAKNTQKLKV